MRTFPGLKWLVASASTLLMGLPLPALAVSNGGFESGFTDWNASGNVTLQSTAPYLATEGAALAAFNAGNRAPGGSLTRILPTEPGRRYRLEFDVGNLSYNASHQKLRVHAMNPVIPSEAPYVLDTIDIPGPRGGATAWVVASYDILSTNYQLRLSFTDVSTTTASTDLVLDNIRLVELPVQEIFNGSFEEDFAGWQASGNVEVLTSPQMARDGRKLVRFNGNNTAPNGSLRVAVATVPGQAYVLSFDYGYNSYDVRTVDLTFRLIDPLGRIHHGDGVYLYRERNAPNTAWDTKDAYFVARDHVYTLEFTDNSGIYGSAVSTDLLLDHVRVTPVMSMPGNAIVNGGFEDGFGGWNAQGNVSIGDDSVYAPTERRKLLVFNDQDRGPNGRVSQTVSTLPGRSYRLRFDAGNFSYSRQIQLLRVVVTTGSGPGTVTLLDHYLDLPGPGRGATAWVNGYHVITATGNSATFTFSDLQIGQNTVSSDLVLDNVRLELIY